MATKKIFFTLCLFFVMGRSLYAQTKQEIAYYKSREAIRLEDEEGKYDEAIKMFEEAEKLDSENISYPYEIAYAYSSKKEYKKATDILEKLLTHKDVYGRVYQALGNAYDDEGMREKAIKTYEEGLKKFPASGELYLELGNMKFGKKDYDGAMEYYENGIKADPAFPSNYYRAAKLFCNSTEEVWGMIYGEIFMNLEPNSKRTAEMSKLLFDTYKNQIKFSADTSFSVSFSKNATINAADVKKTNKVKLPFGMGCYEMIMMRAVIGEKKIDINSLDRIRTRFIKNYFKGDNATDYPNILFNFQLMVMDDGYLEAYNHWILMKGDEDGFDKWRGENKTKWENFINWFSANKIKIDANHKFYRTQY